jgi:hypothetical protein
MGSPRLNELSRFLDQEFDPSLPPDELPRAVALLLEANPFPDDPMSGELEGSPWTTTSQEATGPGNRISRAVVADDLGNRILDLLWEPIEETDVPRMRRRLAALHRTFDEVPSGPAACALLSRLSVGGDLLADFDYRLSRKSRADLRQGLRDRCGLTVPPDPPRPPDPVVIPVPTRPDPQPDPTPPTPTDPTKPAPRLLETIGEAELKTTERRLKRFEKFEIYAWVEATLTVAFEGTDAERAVLKAQWKNGKFKHEVEVKLDDFLGVDFEGEWDKKPELRLKRDIKISKSFTLTPKTKLNPLEPFELEGSVKTPGFPLTIGSLAFKMSGEIKGVAVVRLAWRHLIERKIKDWLRDQVKDLPGRILKFFGTKLVKDRLRLILIAVAGLMLVKLLFDDDDQPSSDEPVPVPPEPGDVEAFAAVFEVAQRQDAARRRLLAEAHAYRNAFAIAFGDTLSKLAEPDWRKRLAAFTVSSPRGFLNLPKAATDDARAWRTWAVDAHKQRQDSVDLRDDAFIRRFRTNEAALMWAILATLMHTGQSEKSVKTAIATAHQQATAAGMAAAVMHVHSVIERETYEFRDEQGRRQTRSGVMTWDEMAAAARAVEPDELKRQRRLARLVTDVLPPIH